MNALNARKIQGKAGQEFGIRPRNISSLLRGFIGHHHITADPDALTFKAGASDGKVDT